MAVVLLPSVRIKAQEKGDTENSGIIELPKLEIMEQRYNWFYYRTDNFELLTDINAPKAIGPMIQTMEQCVNFMDAVFPEIKKLRIRPTKIFFYTATESQGRFYNPSWGGWRASRFILISPYVFRNGKFVSGQGRGPALGSADAICLATKEVFRGWLASAGWTRRTGSDPRIAQGSTVSGNWLGDSITTLVESYIETIVGEKPVIFQKLGALDRPYAVKWARGPYYDLKGLVAPMPSLSMIQANRRAMDSAARRLEEQRSGRNRAREMPDAFSDGTGLSPNDRSRSALNSIEDIYQSHIDNIEPALVEFNTKYSILARQRFDFLYYCLIVRPERYRDALARLVFAGIYKNTDDALFEDCFGIGFPVLNKEIQDYYKKNARTGGWGPANIKFPGGAYNSIPGKVIYRQATRAERARFIGEIYASNRNVSRQEPLRIYTKAISEEPGVLKDPDFLASYGLYEEQYGDKEKAITYLEGAAKDNVAHATVYQALSRLRWRQLSGAQKDGSLAKLTPQEAVKVLEPLIQAHQLRQVNDITYVLMANALANADAPPAKNLLDALLEGCRTFPGNIGMLEIVIPLFAKHGMSEQIPGVLRTSVKCIFAPDEKERFDKLAKEFL